MQSFRIHAPKADISALVFDSPHSGIVLPDHFRYACARHDLMHLHDPHVEKLLADIPSTGTPVLEALIHRTCIDLNRYDDELDPAMIEGGWPLPPRQTFHTQQNLSLFPLFAGPRSNRIAPIYNAEARLTRPEAERRINDYHRPYYAALHGLLDQAHREKGVAIHIDVHSFNRPPSSGIDEIILGNMDHSTCAQHITDTITEHFKFLGYHVGFNGTYFSGGALIQSTGAPDRNRHSLQIEIARDLYMDQETLAFDPAKGKKIKETLTQLAQKLRILKL